MRRRCTRQPVLCRSLIGRSRLFLRHLPLLESFLRQLLLLEAALWRAPAVLWVIVARLGQWLTSLRSRRRRWSRRGTQRVRDAPSQRAPQRSIQVLCAARQRWRALKRFRETTTTTATSSGVVTARRVLQINCAQGNAAAAAAAKHVATAASAVVGRVALGVAAP